MKSILQRMLLTLCLLLSLLMAMMALAIDATPSLEIRAHLTPAQIAKAKRLFDHNDPRRLKPGTITQARLSQQELNLALNYAAHQYADAAASLSIEHGKARILATLPLSGNPLGRYLNVTIELAQTAALPKISRITIGRLPLPGFIATGLLKYSLKMLPIAIDWQQLSRMVKNIHFASRILRVTYQWRPDLPAQLGGALLSSGEHAQIRAYQNRLIELTQTGSGPLALTDLLQPLFQMAAARSEQGKAVQENRAVIRVLAFYVNQKDLGKLAPAYPRWPPPVWRTVTLRQRADFTKHYLVSAFLAADTGTPLADVMGLYKEIQDSRGGSGFSFNDIAADRAGARMGELAIAGEREARALQGFLAMASEQDIMPDTADLPEFMPEADFKQRYGGLEGAAYRQMMTEIERRISALAITRHIAKQPPHD